MGAQGIVTLVTLLEPRVPPCRLRHGLADSDELTHLSPVDQRWMLAALLQRTCGLGMLVRGWEQRVRTQRISCEGLGGR